MSLAGQVVRSQDFSTTVNASSGNDELAFTSTTFTAGSTTVGASFVAPTSGSVIVLFSGKLKSNTSSNIAHLSVEVREGSVVGSGSVVSAASLDSSVIGSQSATQTGAGTHRFVSGLTPGATYNVRTMHCMNASGNGDILYREVTVIAAF